MGFSHEKTTHHFHLLADGGAIEIQSNEPTDAATQEAITRAALSGGILQLLLALVVAFVRIFQQRHRFKEKLRFSAWLFTIALNLCRSSHRWQARHQTVALENEQEQENWETESGLLTSSSPADDASKKELALVVRSAVQALPDKLKAVVLLADYEDLSHHQIAQILGCSPKAVETRLYRAHRILRGKLRDLFV